MAMHQYLLMWGIDGYYKQDLLETDIQKIRIQ